MARAKDVPDKYDFYMQRINGQPASILVNLAYRGDAPMEGYPNLVWAFLPMPEPGDHGMGVGDTTKTLGPIEDRLAEVLKKEDVHFPGRVRGEGSWQLYYYCRDGSATEGRVRQLLEKEKVEFETGTKPDPEWTFFSDILSPDDERMQWIEDGRVVDVLKDHGDPLTVPRPVEHWIYFSSVDEREAFVRHVVPMGFEVASRSEKEDRELVYGVVVRRVDSVELDTIHEVVMDLFEAAEQSGGKYDGWETQVQEGNQT